MLVKQLGIDILIVNLGNLKALVRVPLTEHIAKHVHRQVLLFVNPGWIMSLLQVFEQWMHHSMFFELELQLRLEDLGCVVGVDQVNHPHEREDDHQGKDVNKSFGDCKDNPFPDGHATVVFHGSRVKFDL